MIPAGAPPASSATTAATAAFDDLMHAQHRQHQRNRGGCELAALRERQGAADLEREDGSRPVASEPAHSHVSLRVAPGRDTDHRTDLGDSCLRDQVAHVGIVAAHHQRGTGLQHIEESRLGAEVVFGRAVKVEVLVGHQVGQRADLERESGDTLERDAVEVTSITAVVTPASTIWRSARWIEGASGVVMPVSAT